jgi:peroxiredoxin/uncharacterized membrane protein YphA (DoxX/SURF4 family)
MELVLLIIRLSLFTILAVAGVGKLLDREGSEKAVRAFGTPDPFVKTFAFLIPVAELIFAFCFLSVGMSWVGAAGALLLMVTFIGGMLVQMIQGNAPDCHCFGQIHSEPVGPKSLIRNILIALLPIVLLVSGRSNQGYALGDTESQIAANVAIAIISVLTIVAGSYLWKLVDENQILKRRIELLEMLDNGGRPIERDEAGDPADSLPIGAPFPDFTLPDIKGKLVTFEHLLSEPLPKLFMFVGPSCGPCKTMLDEFAEWKREFEGRINIIFISKDSAADNIERFGEELSQGMLLQKNMEFAWELFIKWTPAALFVTADGNIASHPAVGDMAIRDLVAKLRTDDYSKPGFYVKNSQKRGRVKIGEAIPDFKVTDLTGESITKQFFRDRTTLTFFLSTTCGHCGEVFDEIKRWENSPDRNGTRTLIFAEGDAETLRNYGLTTPLVTDANYKVAANLGMYGVPSAVLIDENGKIASESALGNRMIWSLIGRKPK